MRDEVGFEAPARARQPAAPRRIGPDHDDRPRRYPGGTGDVEDSINGHEPYL